MHYLGSGVSGGYSLNTIATISCETGYRLNEVGQRVCQNTGDWSQESTCLQGFLKIWYSIQTSLLSLVITVIH